MDAFALLAVMGVVAGAAWVVRRPEWTAPFFAFLIYARVSDVVHVQAGVPSMFKFLAPGLLALALARWLFLQERSGAGIGVALWWLAAIGVTRAASLLYAGAPERTWEDLLTYADGVLIVLVVTTFLRRGDDLERVVWALLAAGFFLGVLTIHQQLTGNFDGSYGGFARVESRNIVGDTSGLRSEGPVSPNYFALILVVLVPLAVDRLVHSRRAVGRLFAALTLAVLLASLVYTYSRGALVSLAAVCVLMLVWVPRRRYLVLAAAPLALLALLLPAQYVERMGTFTQVMDGLRNEHVEDSAIRGRLSEVKSAALMFGDHPLLGVGYGNYEVNYQRYASAVGLDGRREERQAHSLYLEVAAEMGLVGIVVFGGMLAYALACTQRARAAFRDDGQRDLHHLATAVGIALVGFLVGSLFLHLSYPRYFWLLVAIALSIGALVPRARAVARPESLRESFA